MDANPSLLLDPSHRQDGGFTQIPNVLLEALCSPGFSDRERRTLLAIVRQTIGYRRAQADIAPSQLAKMTGVAANHISVVIKSLVQQGVLHSVKGRFGKILGIRLPSLWFCGAQKEAISPPPCTEKSAAVVPAAVRSSKYSRIGTANTPSSGSSLSQIGTHIKKTPSKENLKEFKNLVQADASTMVAVLPAVDDFGFERFWDAFADKRGRKAALAIWRFMAPNEALANRIVAAAERYAAYRQVVILPAGRCGAMAKSWLDGERWEDEVPAAGWAEDEQALVSNFNSELGEIMPEVDAWSPQRGASVRGALAVWNVEQWRRFFVFVRSECRFAFPVGFDWLLRNRVQVAEGLYCVNEGVAA